MLVSNICIFIPANWKWSKLSNIFHRGWFNHHLGLVETGIGQTWYISIWDLYIPLLDPIFFQSSKKFGSIFFSRLIFGRGLEATQLLLWNSHMTLIVKIQAIDRLGGGFKYLFFSPLIGEDSHFDEYFWKGLVQPPTSRYFPYTCPLKNGNEGREHKNFPKTLEKVSNSSSAVNRLNHLETFRDLEELEETQLHILFCTYPTHIVFSYRSVHL